MSGTTLTFGDLLPGAQFTMVWDPDNTEWAPGIWRKTFLDTTSVLCTAQSVGHSTLHAPVSNDVLVTRYIKKQWTSDRRLR
jgi:hypothetical protein